MSEILNLRNGLLELTLSLYNNTNIPRNAVQEIISKLEIFTADIYIPYLKTKIRKELSDIPDTSILKRINSVLNENKEPFKEFSTEHLRFKMYKKYCGYIPPEQYLIGHDVDKGKQIQVYAAYVPLQEMLKNFLEIPGLFEQICNYRDELDNEKVVISNVVQAAMWNTKYRYQNKYIMPMFVYYDDFDPGNTLGSHAGQEQLGGVYICLPFLPPHLVAKLNNIFVACIFYTKYRKIYGNKAIFQKVIDQINLLSSDGISLNINGSEQKVYFRCVLLIGDNKALNEMCGFVESFSSTRYCRICTATSAQCQIMSEEDTSLLRNRTNYAEDVKQKRIETGIKENCIFNNMVDFHVTENQSTDMMHDWLEGIAYYIVSKVLTNLICNEKLFDLEKLNDRIENFDYGNLESTNKP